LSQAVRNRHSALLRSNLPVSGKVQAAEGVKEGSDTPPVADELSANVENETVSGKGKMDSESDLEDRGFHSGKFRLPPPPVFTKEQRKEASIDAVMRMFDMMDRFDKTSLVSRKSKLGINRVAASTWDRDGWVTMIARLATRGLAALHGEYKKGGNGEDLDPSGTPSELATFVREKLYEYIMADFRDRTDVAAAWLNEEWYNDKVMAEYDKNRDPQYLKWMMKVMDGIFPFLEGKDRLIIRLLSEIPEINHELLQKVKMLCLDPDRASLGIQILQFVPCSPSYRRLGANLGIGTYLAILPC
jgi:symplekin